MKTTLSMELKYRIKLETEDLAEKNIGGSIEVMQLLTAHIA